MRQDPGVRVFRVCLGTGVFATSGLLLSVGNKLSGDDQCVRVTHHWELAGNLIAISSPSSWDAAQVSNTYSTQSASGSGAGARPDASFRPKAALAGTESLTLPV